MRHCRKTQIYLLIQPGLRRHRPALPSSIWDQFITVSFKNNLETKDAVYICSSICTVGRKANREKVREKKSGIPDSSRRDNGVWRGKQTSNHMQEKQSCHNSTKPERSKTILTGCSELLIHSQMAGPLLPELVKYM